MTEKSTRRSFIQRLGVTGIGAAMGNDIKVDTGLNSGGSSHPIGCRILFQGDSITDGNRGRTEDPNHIMGHGYAFSIASRVGADFPSAGFSFYNRGISGNKVSDLKERWQQDALSIQPDVLSVLVGINDAAQMVQQNAGSTNDMDQFESIYRDILSQSKKANPAILLVLGLPFVYQNVKGDYDHYQLLTSQLAERVKKLATEFNAVLVDYPAAFNKAMQSAPVNYWIWDGIHPTVAGHEIMTKAWIQQVSKKITLLKKYHY